MTRHWTPKIQDGTYLPSWKSTFFCHGQSIWMKFGSLVQNDMPTTVIWSKSKSEVEFQYGGRLVFKTGNSYSSDADWATTTEFGLLIDVDLLERGTSANPIPEAKLCCSGRYLENRYNTISPLMIGLFGWNFKFVSQMQNDMPSAVMWLKSKVEVEFQYGGRLFFPNRK